MSQEYTSNFPTLKTLNLTALIIGASVLTACGGSSSGNTGSTAIDSLPTVSAGADQTAIAGASTQLSSSASDADGDAITYSWTQTSGTSVTLSGLTIASPTFTAPVVTTSEDLVFTVTVTAGGETASDQVTVSVVDGSLPAYASNFVSESLDSDPEIVTCTVGGASSVCMSVTLKSHPMGSFVVGPFCPTSITDTDADGGIWMTSTDRATVHDVDGNFITELSTLYGDNAWQMYDPVTGEVYYTEGDECQAAAVVDPDPDLANHCVQCLVTDIVGVTNSYLIPVNPVDAAVANTNITFGVTFSGSALDRAAPLTIIESNYNIAPFDDCGGHINPTAGYHTHAVTDGCFVELENASGHASQIGIALDGYPIFERLNGTTEPTGLDACRGHNSDVAAYNLDVDYHYHVNAAAENQILPCLTGEIVGTTSGPP